LSSTLLRYFEKSFINHGVHAQLDDLPIVLPDEAEGKAIAAIVDDIIAAQKADASFDYRPKLAQLDELIASFMCSPITSAANCPHGIGDITLS